MKSLIQDVLDFDQMPSSTRIGHVHLVVKDLDSTRDFYSDLLGLQEQASQPGAIFLSSQNYHHHLAANTWPGSQLPNSIQGQVGLRNIRWVTASADNFQRIQDQFNSAGWDYRIENDHELTTLDSSGLQVTIILKKN